MTCVGCDRVTTRNASDYPRDSRQSQPHPATPGYDGSGLDVKGVAEPGKARANGRANADSSSATPGDVTLGNSQVSATLRLIQHEAAADQASLTQKRSLVHPSPLPVQTVRPYNGPADSPTVSRATHRYAPFRWLHRGASPRHSSG